MSGVEEKTPKGILEWAQHFYSKEGIENKQEAEKVLSQYWEKLKEDLSIFVSANRLRGWINYQLAIKAQDLEEKEKRSQSAVLWFECAEEIIHNNPKEELSILNGKTLSLWIGGNPLDSLVEECIALAKFTDNGSSWNNLGILLRWGGFFRASVAVCEKSYKIALAEGDYRSAGSAKQNRGDALKQLGLINDARMEYQEAIWLYKLSEQGEKAQSAEFHIRRVEEKIAELS